MSFQLQTVPGMGRYETSGAYSHEPRESQPRRHVGLQRKEKKMIAAIVVMVAVDIILIACGVYAVLEFYHEDKK